MNRRTALAAIAATPVLGLLPEEAECSGKLKRMHQWSCPSDGQYYSRTLTQSEVTFLVEELHRISPTEYQRTA